MSSSGEVVKRQLAGEGPEVVFSLCDSELGFDKPCMVLNTMTQPPPCIYADHKCRHGTRTIHCTDVTCLQALLCQLVDDPATSILTRTSVCVHGQHCMYCNQPGCVKANITALLSEVNAAKNHLKCDRLDTVLKPGLQVVIANNLEVSRISFVTNFELLRRHQPDPTGWSCIVGLSIAVDTDDFRAIARSALAGRSCVLSDAFGAKAAEKYAEGHFVPIPPSAEIAPRAQDGLGGGSDKSFDMFE